MANLTHVAPHLLQETARPLLRQVTPPPKPLSPPTQKTSTGTLVTFYCSAEVFVRPVKTADGKTLPYEGIVASDCELTWKSDNVDIDLLISAFAQACVTRQGKSMDTIIRAAAASKKHSATFYIYVNAVPGLLKTKKVIMTQESLVKALAIMAKSPSKKAGISFGMDNPGKYKENAAKAELAEMASSQAARKLKRVKRGAPKGMQGDDDDEAEEKEDSDSDSSSASGNSADDPQAAFMNKLFAAHPMNMDYHPFGPVVIDPLDSRRFFLLTHTKARNWAQMREIDGVNVMSPPPSLKYDLVKPTASGGPVGSGGIASDGLNAQGVTNLVVGVIAGLEAHREARDSRSRAARTSTSSAPVSRKRRDLSNSPPPSSSPPYTDELDSRYGLNNFLEFCGWKGVTREAYKSKLNFAGIADFRLINEKDAPLALMEKAGLQEMTARLMYKNVGKYARRLKREGLPTEV